MWWYSLQAIFNPMIMRVEVRIDSHLHSASGHNSMLLLKPDGA